MTDNWTNIVEKIKFIHKKDFVPLHEPHFNDKEVDYVTDCIRTGWVSSVGKYVDRFEKELAAYIGVKRAVAVVNGTAALQIALKLAGVREGDEVLIPSLTFIATANAVTYLQAVPHFVDVSEKTLGIDPFKLDKYLDEIAVIQDNSLVNKQTGNVIRAVVPMHTFGHLLDIDELLAVCEKYYITIVEDAAESLGSTYKGKHAGSFGLVSAVSFNGNKIITTGGGGAILTNNEELADYAKHITTTAKIPHPYEYEHDEIGYNYRLPNINAALGCAQLEKMDTFIKKKRELTNKYLELFKDVKGVTVFTENEQTNSNYWLQTLIIDPTIHNRIDLLTYLNGSGVMSRPIWTPLHELKPYKNCPKSDLSTTMFLKERIINIPSTPILE
jgi:perosamine synthetase